MIKYFIITFYLLCEFIFHQSNVTVYESIIKFCVGYDDRNRMRSRDQTFGIRPNQYYLSVTKKRTNLFIITKPLGRTGRQPLLLGCILLL